MMNISVIGSGTMGNGIAHTFAQIGYHVHLVDISEAALSKGMATISKNLDRQVGKGTLTEEEKAITLQNIKTFTDFKVLFLILDKLGKSWAKGLHHLSYGMVDLPSGKMKSREGTVVDADELIGEMVETARQRTEELGKVEGFSEAEKTELFRMIGLGALKYFLLKVEPKKRLLFDPNESIDFQGNTGPFIQYTHARINSVLNKAEYQNSQGSQYSTPLTAVELDLLVVLKKYPEIVEAAARDYSPALIANYVFELAKLYNKFYHDEPILKAGEEAVKQFRLELSAATAAVIKKGMGLLGIQVPDRM